MQSGDKFPGGGPQQGAGREGGTEHTEMLLHPWGAHRSVGTSSRERPLRGRRRGSVSHCGLPTHRLVVAVTTLWGVMGWG